MYDSFACKALAREAKKLGIVKYQNELSHTNFLAIFEQFADQHVRGQVKNASQYFQRQYPFQYRVIDKYLWLQGSKDRENIIRTFRLGLQIAPIF